MRGSEAGARGRFQRPEVERGGAASLLTVAEVALRCACSRKTIYRAIGRGDLGATRLGSQLRVSHASARRLGRISAQNC